jgi:intracellular septation protein
MKPLLDYFPIVAFLIAYNIEGIYTATAVLIISSFLQIVILWLWKRTFEKMHVITFILVGVLGGLTIALQDDNFIKWKVTVIYWALAIGFAVMHFILGKNPLKSFLGKDLPLPDPVWNKLTYWCMAYFIALGILNIYVAYSYSLDFWVNFKVFGLTAMTFVFTLALGIVVYPYMESETTKDTGKSEANACEPNTSEENNNSETKENKNHVID